MAVVRGATCDRSIDLFTPKLVQVNLMQIIVSVEASSNTNAFVADHSFNSIRFSAQQPIANRRRGQLLTASRAFSRCRSVLSLGNVFMWMGAYVVYGFLSMTRHMTCACLAGYVSVQCICRAHCQRACLLVHARRTFSSPNFLT